MPLDEKLDNISDILWNWLYTLSISRTTSIFALFIIIVSLVNKITIQYLDQELLNFGLMIIVVKLFVIPWAPGETQLLAPLERNTKYVFEDYNKL